MERIFHPYKAKAKAVVHKPLITMPKTTIKKAVFSLP